MKKSFLTSITVIFAFSLFSQTIYNSWDGDGINPHSKFRVLNIFINVIYDVNPIHNNNFPLNDAWPCAYNEGVNNEAIPNYLLGFMDTIYSPQNKGTLTRQFGEASFDALQMIGDYVVVNVKESRVLAQGPFSVFNILGAAIQLINEKGGLQTLYGRNKITDYDFENKNQIYFAQAMIRNITKKYGGLDSGTGNGGFGVSGSSVLIKIGNQNYSFSGKGTRQCIGSGDMSFNIPSVISHEISHSLFGSNSFHTSGGNHRGSKEYMPFLTVQGGHGLIGGSGSGLVGCNGYERWRMHWKHSNAPDYITARNATNSGYVVSDIKKEDGNKSFILRDFVTYGDAIRIKLPYKDSNNSSSDTCSNQYIWLENHQIGKYGKLDFLQWSNSPGTDCRPAGMPGIYAYYQIGRDILSGSSTVVWFADERDNLKMIPAEGYWNYSYVPVDSFKYQCVNWEWHHYLLECMDANPFCGYQDQERQIHPFSNDNIIKLSHEFIMWRKKIGSAHIDSLVSLGDNRDAFSVHSKINMSTNPSTCNTKTYYNFLTKEGSYGYTNQSHRNNETTYLSGLSIEMIPQNNSTFLVNIRWDDYGITNSANWTGKIALKEEAILKSGNTIHLKQNKTPAQFTRDITSGYFAKTSLFICEPNSKFFQETSTSFIVDETSKILFKSGSKYTVSEGAHLTIKSGCTLEVEDCATLEIKGQLIVENGANIFFHSNAILVMESLSNIVFAGNVQQLIAPCTWNNPNITGNTTINQPKIFNNDIVIHPGATLTVTSTLKMADDRKIIIHPGGKLIVDGGKITNACPEKMWRGIFVGGNYYLPQTAQNQGTVELKNGAIIENSRNGVATYNFKANGNTDYFTTGGIIKADNATFINNRKSAEFLSYAYSSGGKLFQNVGYFKNCNFIVDDNNLFSTSDACFLSHITMWDVTGVKITGCTFENNITTMPDRNQAIYTESAGYIVDETCGAYNPNSLCPQCISQQTPSKFKGFNKAIESYYFSKQYAIKIDRSNFTNNNTAVKLTGQNDIQISRSDMSLSNKYSNTPVGISFDCCTGYTVEGNSIYSVRINLTNNLPAGIVIDHAGTDENRIYRNNIFQNYTGVKVLSTIVIQPTQPPRSFPLTGLQFICNEFTNNYYDILVDGPGKVRASQGSVASGADNRFYQTVLYNIYTLDFMSQLSYYYDNTILAKKPALKLGNIALFPAAANPCINTLCNTVIPDKSGQPKSSESQLAEYRERNHQFSGMMHIFYEKGYDKILNDYFNGIIENEELLTEAMNYHEEILAVTEIMAELSHNALFNLKTDSIIDLHQIRDWYDAMYNLSAKYSLAETCYQLEQFDKGFETLHLIPEKYNLDENEMIEHNNYVSLFTFKNQIRESGRTIAELNEEEITQMLYFANASNGLSSAMARGVLCFFYEICLEKEEGEGRKEKGERDEDEVLNPRKSMSSASSACEKNILENIKIHPNPTIGELQITNYELRIDNVEIYDVYGRKLTTNHYPLTIINISHLNSGIYFVKITTDAGEVTKKIIKQ